MYNTTTISGFKVTTQQGYSATADTPLIPDKILILSKLGFRNRFTFAEKVAIEEAAVTDSEIKVLVKDQDSAEFIDPTRLDTIQGVALLVNKGLVTVERSSIILSSVIAEHEIFRG